MVDYVHVLKDDDVCGQLRSLINHRVLCLTEGYPTTTTRSIFMLSKELTQRCQEQLRNEMDGDWNTKHGSIESLRMPVNGQYTILPTQQRVHFDNTLYPDAAPCGVYTYDSYLHCHSKPYDHTNVNTWGNDNMRVYRTLYVTQEK